MNTKKSFSTFVALFLCTFACVNADLWAVLVSGYDGVYFLESSIYATYQTLLKGGVPEDHIILMSWDYFAYNRRNPIMGFMKFDSTEVDGPYEEDEGCENVYRNVKIDYAKTNCTADVLLNVLTGNATAVKDIGTGRVLDSGPDDEVLLSISTVSYYPLTMTIGPDIVYSNEIIPVLEELYESGRFNKMIFHLEMNNAGSLFDGYLSNDHHILAIASTGRRGYLYGTSYNPELEQYTATSFSSIWLDTVRNAQKDKNSSSLYDAFLHLYQKHERLEIVNMYGDLSLAQTNVTDFYGKEELDDEENPNKLEESAKDASSLNISPLSTLLKSRPTLYEEPGALNVMDNEIVRIDVNARNNFKMDYLVRREH